jgi:hypothetical protein
VDRLLTLLTLSGAMKHLTLSERTALPSAITGGHIDGHTLIREAIRVAGKGAPEVLSLVEDIRKQLRDTPLP